MVLGNGLVNNDTCSQYKRISFPGTRERVSINIDPWNIDGNNFLSNYFS